MNKLNKKTIILSLMLMGLLMVPAFVNAQVKDTGTVVKDVTFTDIKGNTTKLYDYLRDGYMVVIELGLTTCPICWQYHSSHLSEIIYRKYGPNGSVAPKKIMPMFIECNPQTTLADLKGTGSQTMGDWVTGMSYPIVDLTNANAASTMSTFMKSTSSIPTPTFVIICPDGKIIYSAQSNDGVARMSEKLLVDLMNGRCSAGGRVSIDNENIASSGVSVKVYPNPVEDMLYIESKDIVHLSISDMQGRVILQAANAQKVPLSGLASGTYLLRLTDKNDQLIKMEKLLKQ